MSPKLAESPGLVMQPLDTLPADRLARVETLLTDIDDTLTSDGRLTAEAYAALEALAGAGLRVVPVTGRPGGWCDQIARFWPVDAVVGENGGFFFRYDRAARRMTRRFLQDEATRAEGRARLAALREEILKAVPGAGIASDQPYRELDLAIDYREDVTPLPKEAVRRIVALAEAAGATAKVSSIHVNIWFGDHDKLSMTRLLFAEAYGRTLDDALDCTLFVGDSPNDAPMFAAFPLSVGVANVRDYADEMTALPAFVTRARSGAGFAELARALLVARGGTEKGPTQS